MRVSCHRGGALTRALLSTSMLAAIAASGFASSAFGQTAAPDSGAINLPPVIVFAPNGATSSPAGASTTLQDFAPERATTSDTASLLSDVPGAAIYSAGGVSGLPVLDGLADDRLHIEVGGMNILAACANHMNPPLSYIDPTHVGDIRVFSGVVPVSVGGDSVGGAILVNPPPPVFAAPGLRYIGKGEIGAYYRSNGNAFGGNLSATAATSDFSVTYNGSYAQSGNYKAGGNFKAAGPAYSSIPYVTSSIPWLSGSEVGSTAYQAQNHDLAFALRHENHLLQLDLGLQNIPYQLYPNQRVDMTGNDSIQANLRYAGKYDWGVLDGQLYHQSIRHEMNFGPDKQFYYGSPTSILAPGMPMDTKAENTGAKLKATVNVTDQHIVRVGGEYQNYLYNEWWPPSPSVLPAGYTMGGMAPNTFWNINNGRRDRIDVFGEWEARWNSQWVSQLGVRSDTVLMNTGPVQGYNNAMYNSAPLYPATRFNNSDRSRTDENLDLTAVTTYTPDVAQTYSAGFSQKSRSPNLYERYAWSNSMMAMEMIGWFGDGNYYIGNLNLKPEVAHTVSVTADWHSASGNVQVQVTPYYTDISNYIDVQRCPIYVCGASAAVIKSLTAKQGFVFLQFVNQSARLFGVDSSARILLANDTPLGAFTAKGVLGYVNGNNTTTGDNLYNMMPINAKLALEQRIAGWTNTIETQFVGAKTAVSQVRDEVKTGAYALLNLRSSFEWQNIRVDFGVENVLNTFYSLPLGGAYLGQGATMSGSAIPWGVPVPGMGRSFYVATNVKF